MPQGDLRPLANSNRNRYFWLNRPEKTTMTRLAALAFTLAAGSAFAAGDTEFSLTLENHKFTPDRLEVPAGKKVKLLVENRDATPAEFESDTLKVEKVIA